MVEGSRKQIDLFSFLSALPRLTYMECYVQDVRIQGCPGLVRGKQLCLSGTGDNMEPAAHQSWTQTWNCFLLLVAWAPGASRMVVSRASEKQKNYGGFC